MQGKDCGDHGCPPLHEQRLTQLQARRSGFAGAKASISQDVARFGKFCLGPAGYVKAGYGPKTAETPPLYWGGLFLKGGFMARYEQAKLAVDHIVGNWLGAPPVEVVARVSDLPISAPADVRGFYRKGSAWIVADTHIFHSVGATVAHEILGHHGVRESLGTNWRPFMHSIQDGLRSGDKRLQLVRSEVRSNYVDDAGRFNLSSVAESDEIVACVAEYGFDPVAGRLIIQKPAHKLAIAAKGQFMRETMYMDHPATFEQLEGELVAAEHRLRHGGPVWGLGFKLRRWYASAMSKPWNPNDRPMSLHESNQLLSAEKDRRDNWEGLKTVGQFLLVGCGVVLILFVLGGLLFDLATRWR